MKRIVMTVAVVLAVLAWAVPAQAWEWLPLDTRQAAVYGATHMARFTYKDMTATSGSQAFTNSIPAKYAVEFVQQQLVTPFATAHAYKTNSVALIVGDGSDTDLFLASTELASDGTEVYAKFGPAHGYTITPVVTMQRATVIGATGITNALVVTNVTVTATAAAGELGRKLYSTAGNLVFTFTPTDEALSTQTAGEVRMFFRVFDSTKW